MSNTPEVILGTKKSVSVEDIYRELSKDFIKHEELVRALHNGYHSGNNVILYGPPGYGKSEISEAFLMALGYTEDEIGVFSVNMDTAPEELFGNINMEKLHSDNKFEMNIHKSIFSKEVVIMEELFDGTPAALASLKHVLTKKVYYYNDQRYEIKTKFIIGCTNKSTSEFNEDNQDTFRALVERFPIVKQVKWHTHTDADYKALLKKKFGDKITNEEYNGLARIFTMSQFESSHISPRIAITATKSFLVGKDVHDLKYVLPQVDQNVINDCLSQFKEVETVDLTRKIEEDIMNKIYDKLDPIINKIELFYEQVNVITDPYEKIAGYDAVIGCAKDVETDFKDQVSFTNETLNEVFQGKVYDRLSVITERASTGRSEVYAEINKHKKDALYVMYSKLSQERFETMNEVRELLEK